MPTGFTDSLSPVARLIEWMQPHRVLDVGVGNGRMGFLAHEYAAQPWNPRFMDGTRVIDGIEGYAPYLGPLHALIYDDIVVGEALETLSTFAETDRRYDLALAIDIVEHFAEDRARLFLRLISTIADVSVVATPRWDLPQVSTENPLENHRSFWPAPVFRLVGAHTVEEYELSTIAYFGDERLIDAFMAFKSRPGLARRILRRLSW
jgi:hypothetical protein